MVEEMAPVRSTGFVDPGWEHGIAQDERKKKVKCNYCGKIVSGGIYRLKQHLARISGEVTYCKKAPEEVYLKMKENLEGCRSSKKQRQSEDEEQASLDFHSNDDYEEEEGPVVFKRKGKQVTGDKNLVISLAPLRSLGYVDPGWEHGIAQDDRKKKVKCNYCEKIVSGGINRFKQHLARIPGEVAYCKKAPEEVYLKMKENMKWHRTGRRQRRPDAKEIAAFYMHSDNDDEEEQDEDLLHKEKMVIGDKSLGNDIRKRFRGRSPSTATPGSEPQLKRSRLDSVILRTPRSQTPTSYKQVKSKAASDKKTRKEVLSAICKFFYHAAIPLNAANSPYFHKMLDLVAQHGQGLKGPSSRLISGRFLQDEIASIKEYLVEFKVSWAITGCTVMADSWKDAQDRTLINFLVSCPRGVYFVSSVDATDIVEDSSSLFKLLDKVVEEMGEENVVQVITENTASYKAAGKMLEEKRKNLFWTPCAAFCIDRMLEDFVKIKWVGECMEKGKKITKFIYNRTWLLNLMKKEFTEGQELLRPAITRFSTSFATLQSLLDHRIGLKKMFQSNKWLSSQFSKLDEGMEVEKVVLNSTFWKKMQYVRKSVDPILQVLQKVDSEKSLSVPCIYNDMYRAKLAIKAIHGDDLRKYGSFWTVIDNHWNSLFHHPLYVAAYFLNPSYRYRPDFLAHPEVIRGLNECIVRLEPDNGRRIAASMQISDFVSAKADFGTELAISTRTELDPAAWWQQHGINCLELQRIAIRILSQTCSSFGCEHNWSTYDQIHSKRRNRLGQKRLNDLIYVHYNLRLRERQLRRKSDDSFCLDNVLLESLLDDWIVETEKQALQEDEEILYNEMEQTEADENEVNENEDGNAEGRKGAVEMGVLPLVVTPMEVNPATMVAATDDDDDLDFLDDDLTD
ncbi:PREDICTED: uncharacterized protein LOC104604119 [Nelumbo nucifera]|uniref:Uncharacterized protein LOC104604119 n=1 Tax=Nelumbo nucifera TaxID=4432 RepID=A0A1U8AKX1_NELNU|nr:PREDICTED: uncharacterized protein LOC104604119 [Nelumbo nucifera]XP_010266651.1 PREDICTED: uncharacterized protein LOC104604119 [Nelumbo nucifera]XP_010266652.1 PREDICTED: uncharacterized protein LOC104604119 [Nelumbo nucifera]